jgi:hypothetical protein
MSDRFRLREARASDHPFVYSAWIRTAWEAHGALVMRFQKSEKPEDGTPPRAEYVRAACRKTVFCEGQHRLVERLIRECDLLVAHHHAVEDEIAGFICFERARKVVHAIYVKKDPWRKQGAARLLMQGTGLVGKSGVRYSQTSRLAERFYGKFLEDGGTYDPFAIDP